MNVSIHIPKQYQKVWERIKETANNAGRGIGWIVCENWEDPKEENEENRD